jgi:hypothetical protein
MGAVSKNKKVLHEEREDLGLLVAIEEGLKRGIATKKEKRDFESWLLQVKNSHS